MLSSLNPSPALKLYHTKTLVHPSDAPFSSPSECPDIYTSFRKVIEGLGENMVRDIQYSDESQIKEKIRPFPSLDMHSIGQNEALGESLDKSLQLLLEPLLSSSSHTVSASNTDSIFKGGETAALARLSHYIDPKSPSSPVATYKQTRNGLLGADFSTKFSPWLACGSLSPRKIWEAIDEWDKAHTEKGKGTKDSYWVRFELLWRDYFVWIGWKYGNALFKLGGVQEVWGKYQDDGSEWKGAEENGNSEKGTETLAAWMEGRCGVP